MFSLHLSKMPYCAAVSCQSGTGRKNVEKYQFFQLPDALKFKGLRSQWLQRLGRDFTPTQHTRVCAKHFKPSDFVPDKENLDCKGKPKKKKSLKSYAIPSLFLRPQTDDSQQRSSNTSKKAATEPLVAEKEPIDPGHSYSKPAENKPDDEEPMDIDLSLNEEPVILGKYLILMTLFL